MRVIYQYEWKQLVRSSAFVWLTLLLFAIGLYAIFYGRNEVKQQQFKISLLRENIEKNNQAMADSLFKKDTAASELGEFTGRLHANNPDGIAALSFGQRDIHKFAQHITNGSFFYNKYATGYYNKTMSGEIVNPFKLLAGHLDLSFVFLFLFPLYFILLSYNLFSSEQENGTIGLLGVQPVPVNIIVLHKLLLRLIIVALSGLSLLLIGGLVNYTITDFRILLFAAAFISYLLCWMGIIALLISFKRSSWFNALALVAVWISFTLLLPSILNAVLNTRYPVHTKTELAAAVQKANAEFFAMDKKTKTDSFKHAFPFYANSFDTIGSWEDPKFYRVTHTLIDNYVLPFESERINLLVKKNEFSTSLSYFSPTLITQNIFNDLAGSNMSQMLQYDTSAWYYFKQISRYTDDMIFLKSNRADNKDFEKLPLYEYKPVIKNSAIALNSLVLVCAGVLLLLSSGFINNKR